MKIIIQIGIHGHLRYDYLNSPSKMDLLHEAVSLHDSALIPLHLIDGDPVHIVGVDMNPGTIEHVKEVYKNATHTFINACVWDKDLDEIEHNAWSVKTDEVHPHYVENREPATTPCLTLKSLFEKVLSETEGEIFGLHLDVEGAELDILQSYDFSILPEFIYIEHHAEYIGIQSVHDIIKLLYGRGYYLWHKNWFYKHRTMWSKQIPGYF